MVRSHNIPEGMDTHAFLHATWLLPALFAMAGCSPDPSGPPSDHFDGARFRLAGGDGHRGLLDLLKWRFSREPGPWPETVENRFDGIPPPRVEGTELRVWFVGHATVLIQTAGLNILTDPFLSARAGPFSRMGPKRVRAPGVRFENLPRIDAVLVSHNHYDHLDRSALARLWQRDKPRILAPLGNDAVVGKKIPVETLDWGESRALADGVAAHLGPMRHWSARGLFDRNKALWGAFVIETPGGNVFFAGDTGYGDGRLFRRARERFGGFRLALLPIGAYEPRWFMKFAHMNPAEALAAFADLGAAHGMAIHFGTVPLADDGFDQPLRDLAAARAAATDAGHEAFRVLEVGEDWAVPEER